MDKKTSVRPYREIFERYFLFKMYVRTRTFRERTYERPSLSVVVIAVSGGRGDPNPRTPPPIRTPTPMRLRGSRAEEVLGGYLVGSLVQPYYTHGFPCCWEGREKGEGINGIDSLFGNLCKWWEMILLRGERRSFLLGP